MPIETTFLESRMRRACELRLQLMDESMNYFRRSPIETFSTREQGSLNFYANHTEPYPELISHLFGEWLYQSRAALDGVIYQLAIHDTKSNPPPAARRWQYPIFGKKEDFDKNKDIQRLDEWTINALSMTQPFRIPTNIKGHSLWWLNELARIDRHRNHHTFSSRINELMFDIPNALLEFMDIPKTRICDKETTLVDHTEPTWLASIPIKSKGLPHNPIPIKVSIKSTCEIPYWLNNVTPSYRWKLDERMRSVEDNVSGVIQFFKNNVDSRPKLDSIVPYTDGEWRPGTEPLPKNPN